MVGMAVCYFVNYITTFFSIFLRLCFTEKAFLSKTFRFCCFLMKIYLGFAAVVNYPADSNKTFVHSTCNLNHTDFLPTFSEIQMSCLEIQIFLSRNL